jgi:hypothetical protein
MQAKALQEVAQGLLSALGHDDACKTTAVVFALLNDYISKECALAAKLGILEAPTHGNEASSKAFRIAPTGVASEIPVSAAFARIIEALPVAEAIPRLAEDTSIAAVELALRHFELATTAGITDFGPRPASPIDMIQVLEAQQLQGNGMTQDVEMEEVEMAGEEQGTVADFFVAPMLTLAASPSPTPAPPPCRRPHHVFDMSTVRRSARLSNAPLIPAVQKAQHNLFCKLGLLNNDMPQIESALQEYIAMFHGPLPQDIIAALTAILNIDNDDDNTLDQVLAGLVNEGVVKLQDDVQELEVAVGAAQLDGAPPPAT